MSTEPTQALTDLTFAVADMTCGNCVRHIEEALSEHFPGAKHDIDLAGKKVTVTVDLQAVSPQAIAQVLDDAGYPARAL